MALTFKAMSNEEEQQEKIKNMLKPGNGTFEILSAVEKVSKTGNPMIELSLKIWDSEGRERNIKDYLVATMKFKLKHLFESIGLGESYQAESINAWQLNGKSAGCILKLEKSSNPEYGDQIKVSDYFALDASFTKSEVKKNEDPFFDDDIPM